MGSADNLAAMGGLHFVGSVPPHQHPDLLAVAARRYRAVEGFAGVGAFEATRHVMGKDRRVVVTHPDESHQKQSRGFDQTLAKATGRLSDLARCLADGRPRRPRRAVDDDARAGVEDEVFGKRVLLTTRQDWSTAQVVGACRSRWQVEGAFRQLDDPGCVAVAPVSHWTDQEITVHFFCCVLAWTVLRLMVREVRGAGLTMTATDLLYELERIQETVLVHPSTDGRPRVRPVLAEMDETGHRLAHLLGLEPFCPAAWVVRAVGRLAPTTWENGFHLRACPETPARAPT